MAKPWEARRDDLVEALRILDLVSSQNNPSSDFFIVESANDGTISMRVAGGSVAEVNIPGSNIWPYEEPFFLDRRLFSPFVSVSKEIKSKQPFQFNAGDRLVITHGTRKSGYSPQPTISGYGLLGGLRNASKVVLTPEVISLMECAATCAISEKQSPVLACVFLNPTDAGIDIMATNGKVVFKAKANLDTPITSPIPFPIPMMSVLRADGLRSIRWGSNCVVGKFGMGKVWQTVVVEALTQFPVQETLDMMTAGRSRENTLFQASSYRFAKVIERLTAYLQSVKKEDWVMKLSGKKSQEFISITSNMPSSVVREQVKTLGVVNKDFTMEWPLNLVSPVFQFVGADKEDLALRVGLSSDARTSYVRCGAIEMIVPARSK